MVVNYYLIEDTTLTAISDAIRTKTGKTRLLNPNEWLSELDNIKASGSYLWEKKETADGDIICYVIDNDGMKYPDGGIGADGYYYEYHIESMPSCEIVSWADGTDEQIVAMVAAADAGEINLADYWNVGDTRAVNLSAMAKRVPNTYDEVNETQVAQTVEFTLMHVGGYELNEALPSGRTECSFIVGLKNPLKEPGYMGPNAASLNWGSCERRYWCNSNFKNAIPTSLVSIFKQFKTTHATYADNITSTSIDYFTLPTVKEVTNDTKCVGPNGEKNASLFCFHWYYNSINRIKYIDNEPVIWWTRTCGSGSASVTSIITTVGDANVSYTNNNHYIAPIGCI